MEFSFMHQARATQAPHANPTEEDPQSVASERLRRAIERNRRRTQTGPSSPSSPSGSSPSSPFQQQRKFSSVRAEEIVQAELVEPIRRPEREKEKKIRTNYSTQERSSSTSAAFASTSGFKISAKWSEFLIKGGWIFCGILLLRLIFSDRGIVDFTKMKHILESKQTELNRIQADNQQVIVDMDKIQNDKLYQRQLIRDNLGFISSDEFLILFGKDNPSAN